MRNRSLPVTNVKGLIHYKVTANASNFNFEFPRQSNGIEPKMYVGKIYRLEASFEAFVAVMIQVEVFWVVTLCRIVLGYCLHLQG
jgi:hypothetical protein